MNPANIGANINPNKPEGMKSQAWSSPMICYDRKKRYRRTAGEIERHYKCPVTTCLKSYGSEGSLSQHMKLKHRGYAFTENMKSPIIPQLMQAQPQVQPHETSHNEVSQPRQQESISISEPI